MSEMTAEPSGGGGGVLGRKVGPLPVWGWLGIVTGGGLAWYLIARGKSGSAAAAAGAGTSGTGSETPSSDVPDYVSQVTINQPQPASPPLNASPDVSVPNTVGQPQEAAYALISSAGLKPATTTPPVKGEVIFVKSQAPAAGAKAARGSTVTVTSAPKTAAKKAAPPVKTTTPPAKTPAKTTAAKTTTGAK